MNIVFFGSDDFAATHLERLMNSPHKVLACVTPPDKPRDRHLKVTALPVKQTALKHRLPLLQPGDICNDDFVEKLKGYTADLFVVIAYGQILPPAILAIPKRFCINVHASLLPKYRGAAPINWAIIHGEVTTGVSIIKMNNRLDAGEIISQEAVPVRPQDTAPTLKTQLAQAGGKLLMETMDSIKIGTFKLTPQNEAQASYTEKLTKEHGRIHWQESAMDIHNRVRGLLPWPEAFSCFENRRLKILETQVLERPAGGQPGEVVAVSPEGCCVATGQGQLCVKRVHLESSRPMDMASFMNGYKLKAGCRFL